MNPGRLVLIVCLALLTPTGTVRANVTPVQNNVIDYQPRHGTSGWNSDGAAIDNLMLNLGYGVSTAYEPYISDNPVVTVSTWRTVAATGYGTWCVYTDGGTTWLGMQYYLTEAARNAALTALTTGTSPPYSSEDLATFTWDGYYGIAAKIHFLQRDWYTGSYFFLVSCSGFSHAAYLPGPTTVVGWGAPVTPDLSRSELVHLFSHHGGMEPGGTVSDGVVGTTMSVFGRGDMELAPRVIDTDMVPCTEFTASRTFYVKFSSPMCTSISASYIIRATGALKVTSANWVGTDQITFTVKGKYKGVGTIEVVSDIDNPLNGACSYPGLVPLVGNLNGNPPTNGRAPTCSYKADLISKMGGDNPAAVVSAFKAETKPTGGVQVTIMTDVENKTDSLVVKRVRTVDDTTVVASLPSKGPSQYIVDDPDGQIGDWYSVHELTEGQLVLQASEVATEPAVYTPDLMPTEADGLRLLEAMLTETPPSRLAMPNQILPILNYAVIIPNETYRAATVPIIADQAARGLVAEAYTLAQISAQYGSELAFRQAWYPYGLRYMLYCGDANNAPYHYWTGGSVPSIYVGTTGYTRYSYGPQSSYNLLPMQYWVDPALNQVQSLTYVTREAGYRSGDVDGDGRNDVAIGNLPCRSPAELALMWRKQRLYQMQSVPATPHLTVWGDFRNLAGNDGWYARCLTEDWAAKLPSRIGVVRQYNNDTLNYAYSYRFSLAISDLATHPIAIAPVSTTTTRVNWCSLNKLQGSDWNGTPITTLYPHLLGGSCDIGDIDRSEDTVNLPNNPRPFIETALADTLHGPATGFGPPRGGFMMPHAKADQKEVEQLFIYGAPDGGTAHMWAMNRASDEDTANAVQYQQYQYFGDPAALVKGMIVTPSQTAAVGDQVAGDHVWLSRPSPNPSRGGHTVVQYVLPIAAQTSLVLMDVQGRQVAEVVNAWQSAGRYTVNLASTTRSLVSGVYFIALKSGDSRQQVEKIAVLR